MDNREETKLPKMGWGDIIKTNREEGFEDRLTRKKKEAAELLNEMFMEELLSKEMTNQFTIKDLEKLVLIPAGLPSTIKVLLDSAGYIGIQLTNENENSLEAFLGGALSLVGVCGLSNLDLQDLTFEREINDFERLFGLKEPKQNKIKLHYKNSLDNPNSRASRLHRKKGFIRGKRK